jgi:mRNA interferase MazF
MVAKKSVAPDRGDVIWITLDPVRGHEQRGRRPALVLSPESYNKKIGLAIICPITSKSKGYVFEVPVEIEGTASFILSDHVRSVDWIDRRAEKIKKAPRAVIAMVQENLKSLVFE